MYTNEAFTYRLPMTTDQDGDQVFISSITLNETHSTPSFLSRNSRNVQLSPVSKDAGFYLMKVVLEEKSMYQLRNQYYFTINIKSKSSPQEPPGNKPPVNNGTDGN